MDKKLRETIRQKFGGKCAFCGDDVSKGMHIWDIEEIQTVVTETGEMKKVNEVWENLYPACKSCASVRKKHPGERINGEWVDNGKLMTIEEFRKDIAQTFKFLRSGGLTQNSYGRSIRFGLIVETGNPIVFHFEKVTRDEIGPWLRGGKKV